MWYTILLYFTQSTAMLLSLATTATNKQECIQYMRSETYKIYLETWKFTKFHLLWFSINFGDMEHLKIT